MASVYGYNTPGDMRVFYTPKRNIQAKVSNEGGIMNYLYSTPETSIFAYLVDRARLAQYLDDIELKATVFVPLNTYLLEKYGEEYFKNISEDLAYRIVRYSVIQGRIEYWLLQTLNYSALQPLQSYDRIEMYTQNGKVVLNNEINVLPTQQVCNNGIILFVDGLLVPYNYS
jgi:hypothetical protein